MRIPDPQPGTVIRYSYLWHSDHLAQREEGTKDRPCVIVLTSQTELDTTTVLIVPITHTEPEHPVTALKLPAATLRRLGLDGAPSLGNPHRSQ